MLTRTPAFAALLALGLLFGALAVPASADWQAGLEAFSSGDLAAAEKEFKAIAESQPDWHGGHVMLGQTLLRQARSAEAVVHLQKALELVPGDVTSSLALAQAAVFEQRWQLVDRALQGLDAAQLSGDQQGAVHRLRGQSAIGRQDYRSAIRDLELAVRHSPKDVKLRYQLASAALQEGRFDFAAGHLAEAYAQAPEDSKILAALTRARYARAGELEGEVKLAACREAAVEGRQLVTPKTESDLLLLVGKIELCAGEHQRAEALLARSASAVGPSDWQPVYHLARSQSLRQDWQAAEKTLQPLLGKSLEADGAARVAGLMGFIYEGQQRFELAIEKYAQIGDSEKIARARESLEIQRRNAEIQRIADEIAEIEKASEMLDEQEEELGVKKKPARQ